MVNQQFVKGLKGSVMVNQHICQGFGHGFGYGESTHLSRV